MTTLQLRLQTSVLYIILNDVYIVMKICLTYGSKNGHQNIMGLKEVGLDVKCNNYSRFNCQRNWRELYSHFTSMGFFPLMMN